MIETTKKHFRNFNFITDSEDFLFDTSWRDLKTYLACRRYLLLPEMIKQYKKVWVTDIDAIFLKPLPVISNQLAYAKSGVEIKKSSKEYERRKIAVIVKADMVYVDEKFYDNAVKIRRAILTGDRRWFADQIALYEVFKDVTDFQYLPPSTPCRSFLKNHDYNAYLISPGGKVKDKEEFRKELNYYGDIFEQVTKTTN